MKKPNRDINPLKLSSALLLTAVITACGSDGSGTSLPIEGTLTGVGFRTAGDFVILSKTGTTSAPVSAITGKINIDFSPITTAEMDTITCPQMLTCSIDGTNAAYTGNGHTAHF